LFALIRIPLDLTRAYESDAVLMRIGVADLTESQLMSAGMVLFGVLMIMRLRRSAPHLPEPTARALP
jgi:prolipoprotein diacylglyceryltransferase